MRWAVRSGISRRAAPAAPAAGATTRAGHGVRKRTASCCPLRAVRRSARLSPTPPPARSRGEGDRPRGCLVLVFSLWPADLSPSDPTALDAYPGTGDPAVQMSDLSVVTLVWGALEGIAAVMSNGRAGAAEVRPRNTGVETGRLPRSQGSGAGLLLGTVGLEQVPLVWTSLALSGGETVEDAYAGRRLVPGRPAGRSSVPRVRPGCLCWRASRMRSAPSPSLQPP